jgi:hypothetical protein
MKIEEFVKVFNQKAESQKAKISDTWYESNYTEFIKSFLHDLSIEMQLESIAEYWKIDYVFYKKENRFENFSKGIWLKKIDVMIENENYYQRAHEEINKLCLWKADLKVLITYYKEHVLIDRIEYWNEILKEMVKNGGKENFLLILGNDDIKQFDKYYTWNNDNMALEIFIQ